MPISTKSLKMLWGRAAGRCSMPDCRLDLYEDKTEADDPTLVGDNCHIVAESDDGPRADPAMPKDQRNIYTNLILLCRNHHKVIDAQEGEYTVERLHRMKAEHETWVVKYLDFDAAKQLDDERYAGMIDMWERLAHVDEWHAWSSYVLSAGQPQMRSEVEGDLQKLRGWLLSRVWPGRYPGLESSFENFRQVLSHFHERFREYAIVLTNTDMLITEKFYQIDQWDPELYALLAKRYDFHVDLVQDLMLELSRAANLICDRVRQHLLHGYRLSDGRLVIQTGPTTGLKYRDVVVQYGQEERDREFPYPGLQAFLTERQQRDMHFGHGTEP